MPDFKTRFAAELKALQFEEKADVVTGGAEPYVTRVDDPLVGLALSGGGIRSATFSLGLLDGLDRFGLLRQFHYLATVSGGGYIGGWWTAFRSRRSTTAYFPSFGANGEEPKEIRHLREFSNFLAPRLGFFEIETWQFISSVLVAVLPSLLAAVAVLILALLVFLGVVWAVIGWRDGGALVLGLVTAGILVKYEMDTARVERVEGLKYPWGKYCVWAAVAVLVTVAVVLALRDRVLWSPILVDDGSRRLCAALGCWFETVQRLSHPLAAWGGALASLIAARLLIVRYRVPATASQWVSTLDRVIGRIVGLGVVWAVGLTTLNAALYLQSPVWITASGVSGGGVAVFLLRKFAAQAPGRGQAGGMQAVLRVLTPQILSYLAVALIVAGIATAVLKTLGDGASGWVILAACLAVVGLTAVFFNPNEVGLHSFYRSRLTRAYLGASNSLAPANRQVTVHPEDDPPLADLTTVAPLHLLCLTANDLAGDSLANFNRGGRSAVLSRFGFAVGNRSWDWNDLADSQVSLGSAMTAAAAALNPNMGSYSTQLGKAVTFLLAMLNIRLGYWLRTRDSWTAALPGVLFFRELFGATTAHEDGSTFHLSDGGHFENLALYELLRRRCRYILVADCGADTECAFDDLGNALRRARADFGVEVEIDLNPLRPGTNGFSRQHVAVGDILYASGDRGIILLVKPTLVGNEPDDVLQYRTRNTAFPHESTGDQFYDESQWESYRRLGLHAARTIFRFAQSRPWDVQHAFGQARFEWYAAPAALRDNSIARGAQVCDIERQMTAVRHTGLLSGLYPELPWPVGTSRAGPSDAMALARLLPVLVQMMQLLDDVFISCEFEQHWNHPLNMGWMNYFGRWFTTPVVRTWWPVLSPMYNRKAVQFAERHFGLPAITDLQPSVVEPVDDRGLATTLWRDMGKTMPPGKTRFVYCVTLPGGPVVELAVVFVTDGGDKVSWGAGDFFVPPSLWAAGVGSGFLKQLVPVLATKGFDQAEVEVSEPAVRDDAGRKEFSDLVQMYREAGFRQDAQPTRAQGYVGPAPRVVKMRRPLR